MEQLWKESRGGGRFPHEALEAAVARLLVVQKMEPRITSAVVAAAEMPGTRLEGLAARVKSPASMARKIKKVAKSGPGRCTEIAANLNDSLRYTAVAGKGDDIVPVTSAVLGHLRTAGFVVESVLAFWDSGAPYKGLHATVMDTESGTRFECQFHSEDSLTIKEGPVDPLTRLRHGGNHEDYEYYRDESHYETWSGQVASSEAYDRCVERSRCLPVPAGLTGLKMLGGCRVRHLRVRQEWWYVDPERREVI